MVVMPCLLTGTSLQDIAADADDERGAVPASKPIKPLAKALDYRDERDLAEDRAPPLPPTAL